MSIFTGAGVAIVTPMKENGDVDFEAYGELIDYQIENGTDAIISCGTTGESSTLSHEEHLDVIRYAIERTAKRVPVIAGTGSNSTKEALHLSTEAEKLGADGLLIVTPYYNKASQDGLYEHYKTVASAVNVPIILYNVPSRTGVGIKPETYQILSKHPNIVATKEANGDIASVAKTRYLCGDDLVIYSGNDDQIVPMMSLGAKGVISVLSNILPFETHQMCMEYLNGNYNTASQMQIKYSGLIEALFCDVNPIPVKEAMNLLGMNIGPCRLPLYPMNDKNLNFLKEKLLECGFEL
jgi:4-hydroxy-tetrahydrodipicolinate synthase